jgi:hypothetical protein
VPATGWILSASEIRLARPAMISDTRQTVIVTARTKTIFLVPEFWASAVGLTFLVTVHLAQHASIER